MTEPQSVLVESLRIKSGTRGSGVPVRLPGQTRLFFIMWRPPQVFQ